LASKASPVVVFWGAAAGAVAIAPAAVFMAALVLRRLPQTGVAVPADHLVDWYAARMWTLWLLLLLMPMATFFSGLAALAQAWTPRFPFVATTLVAAVILVIVVLHMAAN
jgi:hypothetical protein